MKKRVHMEKRVKAFCTFCHEAIYNRMRMNILDKGPGPRYAHLRCVRKNVGTLVEWERIW